jgi:hypothetical protein
VQVTVIENGFGSPYGVMMLDDNMNSPTAKHSVLMHEMGHVFGAGTADDSLAKVGECYSGDECVIGSPVSPGEDETPEKITKLGTDSWPIMGYAVPIEPGRVAFSIEELTTVDTEDKPSVND